MQHDQHLRQRIVSLLKYAGIELIGGDGAIVLLAEGGSDRRFYRVKTSGGSVVVMAVSRIQHETRAYVDVGRFLFANGIGVPEIIACDDDKQLVILEDLGDNSLYALLKQAEARYEVTGYYKKVLMFLVEMQMKATPQIATCSCMKNRMFGYEQFRRETDYFLERFIKQFCGTKVEKQGKLEDELHMLASTLDKEPRYFMHRDFQSQNIYLKEGRVRIIDFQTATRGLLQYDLVSLLKDAYFVLDINEREELLNFYIDALADTWGMNVDRESFVKTFHLAGLQRNMQALGAFSFLSMQKKKKEFMQHIPAGLSHLREALCMFSEFTVLGDIAEKAAGSPKIQA
jgi:hypothetical protein